MAAAHAVTFILPDDRELTLQIDEADYILDAALDAGLELPYRCLQGWCLTCAGRVTVDEAGCVDDRDAVRYFPQDAQAGFVLLCTGHPRCACTIRTHQSQAMKAHRVEQKLPTPRG